MKLESILIGKDILDLLTGAMYLNPLTIYREYIQNAVDSCDLLNTKKGLKEVQDFRIDIRIDPIKRNIVIRDNGTGVKATKFLRELTSIGASTKRTKLQLRGFRGVGRLAGLGYCQKLVFRTRHQTERKISTMTWDVRKLRELIGSDQSDTSVQQTIMNIVSVETVVDSKEYPPHFFEVELIKTIRSTSDSLLNVEAVTEYISQIAPVPFDPEFLYRTEIESFLAQNGCGTHYKIFINNSVTQVYRPYLTSIRARTGKADTIHGIEYLDFRSGDNELIVVGWVARHSYLGALPPSSLVGGLRFRVGNLQIGDADILSPVFPESRFGAWCIGELHVLSKTIKPNGRRDNFEENGPYRRMIGQITTLARSLTSTLRQKSLNRNRLKSTLSSLEKIMMKAELIFKFDISEKMDNGPRKLIAEDIAKLLARNKESKGLFPVKDAKGLEVYAIEIMKKVNRRPRKRKLLERYSEPQRKLYTKFLDALIKNCDSPEQIGNIIREVTRQSDSS